MFKLCQGAQPDHSSYTAIIGKTGLPYERDLKLIWDHSGTEFYLAGIMPRLEELAKETGGIRGIEISADGFSLRIRLKQAPYVDEIILGDFLKALKREYSMGKITVQCEVCHRTEYRANRPDVAEESAADSEGSTA